MRNVFKYLEYQIFLPLASRFPLPLAYRLAEWRGSWMYRTRKDSRQHAIQNIRATFPLLTARDAERIAREHYRTLSVVDVESLWFKKNVDFFLTHTRVDGLEKLKGAAGRPGGALVLLAHWGSVATFFVAIGKRGLSFHVVVRPIERDEDRLDPAHLKFAKKCVSDIGQAIGHPLLYTSGSFRKKRDLLRSGEILMTAFDVTPHILHHIQPVQFFGRTAYFPSGLARLQQETGAHVFYGLILRSKQSPYQRIQIREVPLTTGRDELMQRLVSMLEEEIRKSPSQWTLWDSMEWFYRPLQSP
ncbi:MAG TPA: hypothetical protein VGQ81_02580 [Acidobacteriota bacterium]|jgi:lauroyl/myristoyl acyltransferase|nr:hypothetical protein [Acidobacteriota bacterium]